MNIKRLVQIKWREVEEKTIIHYPEIGDLCYRPYPNHPNGCPNIEKCNNVNVPDFQTIKEWAKFKHYYVSYCIFDRRGYRKQIGKNDNMRWWQKSLKSLLRKEIERIYKINGDVFYVLGCGSGFKLSFQKSMSSMEHACINVFSTMKLNGVKLDLNPRNRVVLCNLLCSKEKLKFNDSQSNLNDFL